MVDVKKHNRYVPNYLNLAVRNEKKRFTFTNPFAQGIALPYRYADLLDWYEIISSRFSAIVSKIDKRKLTALLSSVLLIFNSLVLVFPLKSEQRVPSITTDDTTVSFIDTFTNLDFKPTWLSTGERVAEQVIATIDGYVYLDSEVGVLDNMFSTFSFYPIDREQKEQEVQSLPATLALYEKFRPAPDWLDTVKRKSLSQIYAAQSEPWRDEYGNIMHIKSGFVIMKIPERMAPMYEYVEHAFGISRYVLMAVATIESKQGISMVSPTNCQGWGNFCPGTIHLFQRKQLLPQSYWPYDDYDGIAGIAVHLRVSSLGLTNYRKVFAAKKENPDTPWPEFWNGETPSLSEFEKHSWKYPIIPASWGYNRNSFYGYSVAQLAKFYQEHDVTN